jgi:hypothetical protein
MTNPITIVNATQQVAAAPNQLQQTGAFISQGGTTLAPQSYSLLTQYSDLTEILASAAAITSITWTSGVATATTTAAHGLPNGAVVWLTITGAVPAGYNGTFPCTVTGASTFTYPLEANPGTETTPGTWAVDSVQELVKMATTFFGNGSQQSVYVLELGPGSTAQGVTALGTFIDAQPAQVFYGYLVPKVWGGDSTFITFAATFEAVDDKTYFWTTVNLQNYLAWLTAAPKSVVTLVEAPATALWPANALTALSWSANFISATTTTNHGVSPGQWFQLSGCLPAGYNGYYLALEGTAGDTLVAFLATNPGSETQLGTLLASTVASNGIGGTEFDLADPFWTTLSWNASSSNRITPLSFAFMFGATPFPIKGNGPILAALLIASVNYVGTGAEGGISNAILRNGRTMDGNQFNYWYAIDWLQINGDLQVTNAVINGSNNTANPLWYNQNGINALQSVLGNVVSTGIGASLILGSLTLTELDPATFALNVENGVYNGQAAVNAVPFATYIAANPGNYKTGVYGGLSVAFTPQTGFQQIIINMTAVQFAAA